VKFADLLQFQRPTQSLEELHANVMAIANLNPRSRTEFVEECEMDAKDLITKENQESNEYLSHTYNICNDAIISLKTQSCADILMAQNNHENALLAKKLNGLEEHTNNKNGALVELIAAMPLPDVMEPLRLINQYDSLQDVLKPFLKTALPFRFRLLSRANEIYGANNWETNLENIAENFYDLLTGAADDAYHADFEPVQDLFFQGVDGNFCCNKMLSSPYNYSGGTSTAPMAAVGTFSLKNITAEDQPRSINFALSSYNFAAVFIKIDEWTPLFQATNNTYHSTVMTADFVVPAYQTATILLVSTPYYYRYSNGRGTYNSHLVQFLQWQIFGVRAMLGDELEWRF
jgi:hypothetical protein